MQNINLHISHARLTGFSVQLSESNIPHVNATLGLISDDGREITTISAGTQGWNELKFTLPPNIHPPLARIIEELETVLILATSNAVAALPE